MPFAQNIRRIEYLNGREVFIALIEIVHKKGAFSKELVLYRYNGKSFEMTYLPVSDKEKISSDLFSIACAIWASKQWKKTTNWLYAVATEGDFQVGPESSFVKVGRPNRCKERRSRHKFVLRFGELGHLLLKERAALEQVRNHCTYGERGAVEQEIDEVNRRIAGLLEEMKCVRDNATKRERRWPSKVV